MRGGWGGGTSCWRKEQAAGDREVNQVQGQQQCAYRKAVRDQLRHFLIAVLMNGAHKQLVVHILAQPSL